MTFRDRDEAAHLLAERLTDYRGRHPLILAIPRGAVPMGAILADALDGELDVVLVHKLGAPGNPEFAIGSVDEAGHVELTDYAHGMRLDPGYVDRETRSQKEVLKDRRKRYTPVRPPIDPAGRVVIVVDDGIATGATLMAALKAVRAKKPARLVAAVGVAPPETLTRMQKEADEVVCLRTPRDFFAVGQFFASFPQVSDEEVIRMLKGGGGPQQGA